MKKILIFIILILTCIWLSACTQVQQTEEAYVFKGETNISVDDRSFTLEDIPENMAEEIVIKDFLCEITADFGAKSSILANIEPHKISIENDKERFKEGIYMQSYVIHEISTLTEKEYDKKELDNGHLNPLYYYGWDECVEKYKLTEYEIVHVNFTQTHSKKSNEQGPQWGNGTYSRSFILGKTAKDNTYKIFDFGMI